MCYTIPVKDCPPDYGNWDFRGFMWIELMAICFTVHLGSVGIEDYIGWDSSSSFGVWRYIYTTLPILIWDSETDEVKSHRIESLGHQIRGWLEEFYWRIPNHSNSC